MTAKYCFICKKEEKNDSPLFENGYYPDVWMHLRCLNSREAIAWRKEKENEDPLYKRYVELSSIGQKIICPLCSETNYLTPKFTEHSLAWELCCNKCNRVDMAGIDPYKSDIEELLVLSDDFIKGKRELSDEWNELEAISNNIESRRGFKQCGCGGSFTVLAKPRCWSCGEVIYDTVFHFADKDS